MLRVLLLILVFVSMTAYAQTKEEIPAITEHPFDEFGMAANGDIKARMDNFWANLANDPTAQGYIVNYGSARDVARRETMIRSYIRFRQIDAARTTFIRGGFLKEIRTQLWIVPSGAQPPPIMPTAEKVDEFGKLSAKNWKARFDEVLLKQENNCSNQIYIIIYAQEKIANSLGKKYLDYVVSKRGCGLDPRRVFVVRGKFFRKQRTEIWIVPPDAEPPTP